eukprot:659593-Rhodomonas_salina.2
MNPSALSCESDQGLPRLCLQSAAAARSQSSLPLPSVTLIASMSIAISFSLRKPGSFSCSQSGLPFHALPRLPGWQFWYETPFKEFPFDFAWSPDDAAASPNQPDHLPNGVAWHADSETLFFLEFTRAWDEGDSLSKAEARKAEQYRAAERAVRASPDWKSKVSKVDTLPFVFGVQGSVRHKTLHENLLTLDINLEDKMCDNIITLGIRAAITEALQVCVAHKELAKTAPKAFGPHLRHQCTVRGTSKSVLAVPPKPASPTVWPRDRGGG